MDGDFDLLPEPRLAGCGPLLADDDVGGKPLRQRIFEFVRAEGKAARTDISRALGVSPGSATTLTAELIQSGLLREVAQPPKEQGRGRPPVALELIPEAGRVAGIRLAYEHHTATLTDFSGTMIAHTELETTPNACSLPEILDDLDRLMGRLLAEAGLTWADINGVGIGMPGIIDHDEGIVGWSPILTERDQAFGAAFKARFGVDVYLENDANMSTLSELWFGAGRAKTDFAVVTIENGVGMGLVLNNRLYRGSFGMGLELGHTKVQIDGALCRCGQRGCLEAYLADYALAREAVIALGYALDQQGSMQTILDALFREAQAGNMAALTIFRRAGRYLSLGLSNVIQLFDPALIVLSGERMRYDHMFAGEVIDDVQALTLSRGHQPCRIEIKCGGDLSAARGASALALSSVTDAMFSTEGRVT